MSAIFGVAGLIPSERPDVDSITARGIEWNYTTVLNIVFFGIARGALWALTSAVARATRSAG